MNREETSRRFRAVAEQVTRQMQIPAWGICGLDSLSGLIPCRGKSRLPQSGSVLMMALPYYTGEFPGRNLSRYAVCDDYHAAAGAMLKKMEEVFGNAFPEASFVSFVDSSPIPEVEAGWRAGLGWRGRNGQLFVPDYGSAVFLCEVVTDLLLEPSKPREEDFCGDCQICRNACPTGALRGQSFDREHCRSHITQKKGELSDWEIEQIQQGKLVWGCDICTFSCPKNRNLPLTPIASLRCNLEPILTREKLDILIEEKSYGWRGKKVLERNLSLLEEKTESKKLGDSERWND